MENRRKNTKRRRRRRTYSPVFYAGVTAVAVALVILLICCLSVKIDMQLNGGSEPVVLVYGKDTYQEQGATATANGKNLNVSISDNIDTTKLGTYQVTYSAQYFWTKASAVRVVQIVDATAPVITLVSDPDRYTMPGEPYQEEGFTALDDYDGDLTGQVERIVTDETITYKVKDSSGNEAIVVRQIRYADTVAPQIVLKGESSMTIQVGNTYHEPGFTATDDMAGDITDRVQVRGEVDTSRAGTYNISYLVSDDFGNETKVTRKVTVKPIKQPDIVDPDGKVIYLTFDDGPGPYTQQLLDILERYNVKATFFVVNTDYNMATLLKNIVEGGHSIGIHSMTHEYSEIYASEEAFFEDLYGMQDLIERYTGVKTMLSRFPGGSLNANRATMAGVTQRLKDEGFRYFDWHVDSDDWKDKNTQMTVDKIIAGISGRNTAVVLQHDIYSTSVAAVEEVIVWGLQNGYTFLPLTTSSPVCEQVS